MCHSGNKHIDRAVHGAVLKSGRRISFPIPKNSDAESAKSLIVHILKVRDVESRGLWVTREIKPRG